MSEDFDFEIPRVVSTIRQRECESVILQFPEGLKRRAMDVTAEISKNLPECYIVVSGEPCFGACDVPQSEADLIVNFGHLPIPSLDSESTIMFVQARSNADPTPVLKKSLDVIPQSIGLLTTAQHLHLIPMMAEFLSGRGKVVRVGKGDGRLYGEGQILGCNASSAKAISSEVEAFLFIGTGAFHAIAIALSTTKPVFIANPITEEVRTIDELRDRLLRQRHAVIHKAKESETFGVLVSTKPGQRRIPLALKIHNDFIRAGKKSVIVEMENVSSQKLNAFGLDCWVSTACPRLAIDDSAMFENPVITPIESEVVLGIREWEDYEFDQI
jgi:2-(3-amino-3-carboxypropyl)histidine synthase